MPDPKSPRQRGPAGRAASARFVEIENTLPSAAQPAAAGLTIEAEGIRLSFADRTAVAILADLLGLTPVPRKGGRP